VNTGSVATMMSSSTDNNDVTNNKPQINSLYETLKAFSTRGIKRKRITHPTTKEDALQLFVALSERGLVSSSSIAPRREQALMVDVSLSTKKKPTNHSKNTSDISNLVGQNNEKSTTNTPKRTTNDDMTNNVVSSSESGTNDNVATDDENVPADTAITTNTTTTTSEGIDGRVAEDGITKNQNNDVEKKKYDNVERVPLNFVQQDEIRFKRMEEEQSTALEGIEKAKQRVFADQADLWGVYKYGLQHVLNLNDLSDAPDAILPGNF
jgi:hypothetical protein